MIIAFPKRNAVDLFRDWVPKWMEPVVELKINHTFVKCFSGSFVFIHEG